MSDSRKYLLGATATIVAARIAARAHERSGRDQKPADAPALKDEFLATYRELEQALAAIDSTSAQKPYGDKNKRENERLSGD